MLARQADWIECLHSMDTGKDSLASLWLRCWAWAERRSQRPRGKRSGGNIACNNQLFPCFVVHPLSFLAKQGPSYGGHIADNDQPSSSIEHETESFNTYGCILIILDVLDQVAKLALNVFIKVLHTRRRRDIWHVLLHII